LIELGFLKYVAEMRAQRQAQLFPKLKPSSSGWGDRISKWFGLYLDSLGLTDKKLVLHSFRHGGIHHLHQCGCPQDVAERLTGHAPQGVHNTVYAHRDLTALGRLKEGLECLQYPEVVKALKNG
jgi:integrase